MKLRLAMAGILVCLATSLGACGPSSELATGVVIAIKDGPRPLQVAAFTLRGSDGSVRTFEVGQLELDRGSFDAAHLRVHELTGLPIVVAYRVDGNTLIAYRLVDAAVPSV